MRPTILISIFCFFILSDIAVIGQESIPKRIKKNPQLLAAHLTSSAGSEKEMVMAIHEWITNNIKYDVKQSEKARLNKNQEAEKVLRKGKAVCYRYSSLFKEMCEAVEINCEIIPGYVKNEDFIEGKYLHIDYHTWNAFEADGKWYLCDPTWDAGHMGMDAPPFTKWIYRTFRKKKKDSYPKNSFRFIQHPTTDHFMIAPDTFLLRHLPSHPMWQLRSTILPISVFEKEVDSLRLKLNDENYIQQDYSMDIEDYQGLDEEEKPIFLGEVGYAFNPRNATIKALEYAKYLTLLGDKEVRDNIRNSSIARRDLAIFLNEKNDTVKKYLKLAKTSEKDAFKNNKKIEKAYFKAIKNTNKSLEKSLKTVSKNLEKNNKTIKKANKVFGDLVKKNKKFNVQFELALSENYHGIEEKEDIAKLEALRKQRAKRAEVLQKEFSNENLSTLYKTVGIANEYTKYAANVLDMNNHLIDDLMNEIYFKQDSLLTAANDLATTKIIPETFTKDFIDSCKSLIR